MVNLDICVWYTKGKKYSKKSLVNMLFGEEVSVTSEAH